MSWERFMNGIAIFLRKMIAQRKWILVGVGFFIFGLTQLAVIRDSYFFQFIEAKTVDWRYRLRPVQAPNTNIVLVGITPSSLDLSAVPDEEIQRSSVLREMRKPYKGWDRQIYTAVLKKLMEAGASVVVFDFVFLGENLGDVLFAEAIEKYQDHVVLGSMFTYEEGQSNRSVGYITPKPLLLSSNNLPVVGFVTIWPEVDGVIRRGHYRTSLLREFGRPDDTEDLIALSALGVKKFLGKLVTPDYYDSNFINFSGPALTFPIYPLEDLFSDKTWNSKPYRSGALFKDKIVVVGPADEIFKDQHMTPLGMMLGLEVQANLISTLLTNSSLQEWPYWSEVIMTAVMVVLAAIVGIKISDALLKVGMWLILILIFGCFVWWMFVKGGVVVAFLSPFLAFAGVSVTGAVLDFAAEQMERARVSGVLNRYVAPNVVKLILNERQAFLSSLKGTKRAVSVLFSDLRSFTTFTEEVESETLVAQLNEYFSEMVELILAREGTLHKFIGDSLMAVWGDTYSRGLEVDAREAVGIALSMTQALERLNEKWQREKNRRKLYMGIGIDHGAVVVGNVGHPKRMEFTVLGDAVNTASRIESATKSYRLPVLVSESIYELTKGFYSYRFVDRVQLRGKSKPILLYAPLSESSVLTPLWLMDYHQAVSLFQGRQFSRALTLFEQVHKQLGEDVLCDLYEARCKDLLAHTPSESWEAVFSVDA
ncbi:MAG: adenylate/guanylate cyclase domain-containing protein [Verrucomicrobiae bacterium]|nr:adenylate/guanylate cyclase domain-containing protein [Verrucomicrobiae bacterium]